MKNVRAKEISLQQEARNRIDLLRIHLDEDESDKEYIHRIRVDIKYLRAWLRLTRINTETMGWKMMDRNLSEQSKHLGLVRDTQAIGKTIKALCKAASSKKEKTTLKLLRKNLAEIPLSEIDLEATKKEISSLLNLFQKDFIFVDSIESINKKLGLSFKKARNSGNNVFLNNDTTDELHKFRKWVKHLYYQLKYMGGVLLSEDKKELNKLGKELGDAHDLLVLKEMLPELVNMEELNSLDNLINCEIERIVGITRKRFERLSKLSFKKLSAITV